MKLGLRREPSWLPPPLGRAVSGGMHRWLAGWARDRARKALVVRPEGERHLLVAICDHFEPLHGRVPHPVGLARVRAWREELSETSASRFRDSERAVRPNHATRSSFPGEEFTPALPRSLTWFELASRRGSTGGSRGYLHHDGDSVAAYCDNQWPW